MSCLSLTMFVFVFCKPTVKHAYIHLNGKKKAKLPAPRTPNTSFCDRINELKCDFLILNPGRIKNKTGFPKGNPVLLISNIFIRIKGRKVHPDIRLLLQHYNYPYKYRFHPSSGKRIYLSAGPS